MWPKHGASPWTGNGPACWRWVDIAVVDLVMVTIQQSLHASAVAVD